METILSLLRNLRFANMWFDIQQMGVLKEHSFLDLSFGYERWRTMRPGRMWTAEGKCYVPLLLGIWKREAKQDST